MSIYTSKYPDLPIDEAYKRFFEDFYRISDTPEAHDEYASQFTEDATLIMASKYAKGAQEILALRKGLWDKVSGRTHDPIAIFPFGPNAHEFMLYGTVDSVLKAGGSASVDWSARAVLSSEPSKPPSGGSGSVEVPEGRNVKLSFYQVYLDTAAQGGGK